MIYFDITKIELKLANKLQLYVRFQGYAFCCMSIKCSSSKEIYGFNLDCFELLKSNYFIVYFVQF